jgi:hypothetical protein
MIIFKALAANLRHLIYLYIYIYIYIFEGCMHCTSFDVDCARQRLKYDTGALHEIHVLHIYIYIYIYLYLYI